MVFLRKRTKKAGSPAPAIPGIILGNIPVSGLGAARRTGGSCGNRRANIVSAFRPLRRIGSGAARVRKHLRRSQIFSDLKLPGGRTVAFTLRVSVRARNLLINISPLDGAVELVLPRGVSQAEGRQFLRSRLEWIAEEVAQVPPRVEFAPGAELPFIGRTLTIRQAGNTGEIGLVGGELHVPGHRDALAERVQAWLRQRAEKAIRRRVYRLTDEIGRKRPPVVLMDTRTQWGSCTPDGTLTFSWRIAFAPRKVFAYVIGHEVAHLVHFNHGPRFWKLVEKLCGDIEAERRWLNDHGHTLHRYG